MSHRIQCLQKMFVRLIFLPTTFVLPSKRKGTPVTGRSPGICWGHVLLEKLRTRLHPETPKVSVLQADLGVPAFLHRLTAASIGDVTSEGVGGVGGGGGGLLWD